MTIQIAIDGPAGAGKSTVAKAVAKRLGINYMDTGAMYRAAAYYMLKQGIDPGDRERVLSKLDDLNMRIAYKNGEQQVFVDGEDVMPYLRTPIVSKGSSDIATIPEIRLKLVPIQRETAESFPIIMDGRDIGTYVLPHARVKFYITASVTERARRRRQDLETLGVDTPLKELEQEIADRDFADSNRAFAPLRQAEDAILLDTSEMDIDMVVEAILTRVREVYGENAV